MISMNLGFGSQRGSRTVHPEKLHEDQLDYSETLPHTPWHTELAVRGGANLRSVLMQSYDDAYQRDSEYHDAKAACPAWERPPSQ